MDVSNLAMIALYPDEESKQRLADYLNYEPDSVDANELHLTLVFLGETANLPVDIVDILTGIEIDLPIDGVVTASALFGDQETVTVFLIDSKQLIPAFAEFDAALWENGVPSASEHGFIPHITVGYGDIPFNHDDIRGLPVSFDRVELVMSGEHRVLWTSQMSQISQSIDMFQAILDRLQNGTVSSN